MAHHWLRATEQTVKLGLIDRSDPPVLSIESGDEVSIETWGGWGNAVDETTTLDDVMGQAVTLADRGPHDLTGPIEAAGARSGQVLRVDVLELSPAAHGTNLIVPGEVGVGLLPDMFAEGALRHYTLDLETHERRARAGADGTAGAVSRLHGGRAARRWPHSSIPPGRHGGNIDLKDLVVGSTLYLPIFNDGAMFYAGDGHALQGNGEVDVSALEVASRRRACA